MVFKTKSDDVDKIIFSDEVNSMNLMNGQIGEQPISLIPDFSEWFQGALQIIQGESAFLNTSLGREKV